MKEILKILGVIAEGVIRLMALSDKQKQDKRNEQITANPVGSFEQRFGELHDDPSAKHSVSTSTAESRQASTPVTGTGDIHR